MRLTHVSLFSGIGGFDLAAEAAGFQTICFVEQNKRCQAVLRKHWPGVEIVGDVDGWKPPSVALNATLITAGFPCQPHSIIGRRQGAADSRDKWPETAAIVRALQPRWFVAENVSDILTTAAGAYFRGILADLAAMGRSCFWGCWGANDVGALQPRERWFLVSYRDSPRLEGHAGHGANRAQPGRKPAKADRPTGAARLRGPVAGRTVRGWESEPGVARMVHGVPNRVDRIISLGNAVVPAQAFPIFEAIAAFELAGGITGA